MDILSELVAALPRCNKGCCMAPATRIAPYENEDGKVVAQWDSCDKHGGDTIQEFGYAEKLRAAAHALQANGRHWWDGDELRSPSAPSKASGGGGA
jgi:hypothetical protein